MLVDLYVCFYTVHPTSDLTSPTLVHAHPGHVPRCINNSYQWTREMLKVFDDTKDLPVLLLGLKRDLRSEKDPNGIIYPAEGHKVAQECRMDRYMECSAVSGELVHEVFEDICRTAAMSLKEGGGLSEGGCEVM